MSAMSLIRSSFSVWFFGMKSSRVTADSTSFSFLSRFARSRASCLSDAITDIVHGVLLSALKRLRAVTTESVAGSERLSGFASKEILGIIAAAAIPEAIAPTTIGMA